ncbi:alpha-tocopherol transfer protein-like [Chironomus tepperi]|uniref:alpha-tocopherol transfer protein-like n=1 Tax=Chironomus tepperi TaxID=113505 RepID=UPI00391FA747
MFEDFKNTLDRCHSYKKSLKRLDINQESVNLLREKINNSKHVPKSLTDKQLLFFLNRNRCDIDRVATLMENFYKNRTLVPEFFKNRDVFSKEIQNCLENQYYIILPVTSKNQMLFYHSIKNTDPNSYDFNSAIKVFCMLFEAHACIYGPLSEAVFIFDMGNISFRYLLKPSLSSVRRGFKFLNGANPIKIRKINVFNTLPLFDLIAAMIKPFMKPKIFERIHLFHSNVNFEKFHESDIPKSHLPKEYGGTLGTLDELQEKTTKILMDLRDYFILEEKQRELEFEDYILKHPKDVKCYD